MVELETNNTSATKINDLIVNTNGKKKCKKERVSKYLYRYKVQIKDTKKYMIRVYSEKLKDTKRKKCKKVHKYIKSGNRSKNKERKYVRGNTCDVEQEGVRKNNTRSKGKVSICKRNNNQKRKIKTTRMLINEREYTENKGRVKKKIKKNITIPLRKGPWTHAKSTDRTRGKCTVHIISRRDSVREGSPRIKKSLCDVCHIMYKDNRYRIKCVITKCDVVIDLNKMSTEPMDIPEGGGGGGGKGDGEKGKKNSPSLYVPVYGVMPIKSCGIAQKIHSKLANEVRCNQHKIWNINIKCRYKVAVRHDRYGE